MIISKHQNPKSCSHKLALRR